MLSCKLPIELVHEYGINLSDRSGMNRGVHVPLCKRLAGMSHQSTLSKQLAGKLGLGISFQKCSRFKTCPQLSANHF